ncbi:MAG: SGNH/GDSL hydrolase family protein [candidate division Zixibacteria bacterium]|nr:SGNH/GDSL hydrolase family protein [candidate division Zixibacteria bacterium]
MPHERKQSPLYVKLIGAAVSVMLFILLAELVLNLVNPDLYYKNQFFPLNRDIDFPEVYEKDHDLFWCLRPHLETKSERFSLLSYRTNSLGLRGPEVRDPKDGYRIIALGNSCTFGWGMPWENTWTYNLQQILDSLVPDKKCEVINAGIPGYSTHQAKIFLARELVGLRPDMVLVMLGWNDQWSAGQGITDAEQDMPSQLILDIQNLLSRTRLYRLMRKAVLSASEEQLEVRLDDVTGKRRVSLQEYFKNLREIARIARNSKARSVFLVPPVASLEIYFDGTLSDFHSRHETYQAQVVRAADYAHAPLVDLQAAFDQYVNLFDDAEDDPIHFNNLGHQVVARTVAKVIVPILQTE